MLSYMVAQTIMVLMAGSLADRFGRKRLYFMGLVIFTIVSFLSGFLHDATWLIVFRAFQGIGGAMVMATSTAIVADAIPKRELGRALGINVMVVAVGQIIGPVLGGWLTTYFGWQWTFWFNVPFGVAAVLWAIWAMGFQDLNVVGMRKKIDNWGNVTYLLGVTGFLLVCTWGPIQTWNSPVVWVSLVIFVICAPIFFIVERKHKTPLLHLPLFSNRIFSLGILSATLNAVARMAILFLLIFYFTPYWELALWMVIAGVGSGLFNSPNSSSLMNATGQKLRGEASGIRALATNMGMMLSIAFIMPLLANSIPHEEMLAIFSGTVVGINGATDSSLQGFINGLHMVFWVMAVLMLLATVISSLRSSVKDKTLGPQIPQPISSKGV